MNKGFQWVKRVKATCYQLFVENIFVYLDKTRKRLFMFTNIFAPYYQIQLKQKKSTPKDALLY